MSGDQKYEQSDGRCTATHKVGLSPFDNPRQLMSYLGLTPREYQIVAAVAGAWTNKDIANRFAISETTVKHHLTSIFGKVGVSSRLALGTFAVNHGLHPLGLY